MYAAIWMLANSFFWLLVLVGAGFLVYAAVRGSTGTAAVRAAPPQTDPLSILATRYAKGEIGREEFLQARADLRGGEGQ